jgi:hypothetical protein
MEVSHELTFFNSARYRYLREISEPRDTSLRLVVDEAVEMTSDSARDLNRRLPNLKENLTNVSAIETTESCRSFALIWESYVAYLVTEECAGRVATTTMRPFEAGYSVSIATLISSTILRGTPAPTLSQSSTAR